RSSERPPRRTPDHLSVVTLPFHGRDSINSDKSVEDPKKNEKPIPPLHEAIKQNQVEVVRNLLQQSDINCNEVDSYGKTPLTYVIEGNSTEICDLLLLKKDINVNIIRKNQDSPLCHAIKNGNIDICEKLINSESINLDLLN
ncbi:unnamed protein product, partial [Meganyctiphanes norvegica]